MPRRGKKPKSRRVKDEPKDTSGDQSHSFTTPDSIIPTTGIESSSPAPSDSQPTTTTKITDKIPNRRFHLETEYDASRFSASDIEVPRDTGWVYIACPRSKQKCPTCKVHVAHTDCLVIAIDGTCLNNGQFDALSSFGIYCGDGNIFNQGRKQESSEKHTTDLAELEACARVLMMVVFIKENRSLSDDVCRVIIKGHSGNLVRGMTEWMAKWKTNKWKTSKGSLVANIMDFMRIDYLLEEIGDEFDVQFWLVPRKLNQGAVRLAKCALGDVRGSEVVGSAPEKDVKEGF
ncbi:ribonuclease H-like domain-containing protein [Aspergillus cavernicola]|uniref:Ribonuclease H-like domain-containing protein n=1 Tax=Aspergillus cavernicola TaxID=176166 RepID=A0ABR4I7S4_9EURO